MGVILIVEDVQLLRLELNSFLRRNGYSVLMAENGKVAIEILKINKDINLVLSDIEMPGIDGLEMAKKIRCELKYSKDDLPIVILSAVNPITIKEKLNELDILFAIKPFHKSIIRPLKKLIQTQIEKRNC